MASTGMSAISDYLENKIREHIFKATSFTMPTVLAISLHTADPTDTGAGAEVANSNAYARQTLNPSAGSNWTKDGTDSGKVTNASDIVFPTATGAGWGTITHMAIWDNATWGAGNMLFSGALLASKVIGTGDVFKYLAGDLSITFQ